MTLYNLCIFFLYFSYTNIPINNMHFYNMKLVLICKHWGVMFIRHSAFMNEDMAGFPNIAPFITTNICSLWISDLLVDRRVWLLRQYSPTEDAYTASCSMIHIRLNTHWVLCLSQHPSSTPLYLQEGRGKENQLLGRQHNGCLGNCSRHNCEWMGENEEGEGKASSRPTLSVRQHRDRWRGSTRLPTEAYNGHVSYRDPLDPSTSLGLHILVWFKTGQNVTCYKDCCSWLEIIFGTSKNTRTVSKGS